MATARERASSRTSATMNTRATSFGSTSRWRPIPIAHCASTITPFPIATARPLDAWGRGGEDKGRPGRMRWRSAELESVALTLVAEGKGILAADETSPTLTRRFDTLGIQSTEQSRRTYREMLFTSPGAAEFISGV